MTAKCQDAVPAFTLSTTTSVGLLDGMAYEEVYNQAVSTNYKNSELTWPFEPLFYVGAGLSLDTRSGFFATLDLREGLDGKTGSMTDSDFLNGDGVKTNFSQSDCYTERAILLDLKVGYDYPLGSGFKIGFYGGFSYMDFKWSARDGYYQYPTSGSGYYIGSNGVVQDPNPYNPWSPGETKTPLYGIGILYEQAYLTGSLGLRASYRVLDRLTLAASFSFSPLTYCYTEDNHVFRTVDFYSTLSGGIMLEPGISAEYAIKPGASLKLAVSYRTIYNLIGDITQVDQGTTSTSSGGNYYAGPDSTSTGTNGSGASISMLDASLVFRLVF
jgi:plasminogen activator